MFLRCLEEGLNISGPLLEAEWVGSRGLIDVLYHLGNSGLKKGSLRWRGLKREGRLN